MPLILVSALLLAALAPAGADPAWPVARLHEARSPVQRLPVAERAAVDRLLRPHLGPLFQGTPPQLLLQTLKHFRIEQLRLGRASGLIVQASGDQLCSPTGNCSFWVLDLQHRRILLSAITVQTFAVDSDPSSPLPAIVTGTHSSATESDLTRWRFDGTRYIAVACATVDDADADAKPYPQPKVTPHPCNPEGTPHSR